MRKLYFIPVIFCRAPSETAWKGDRKYEKGVAVSSNPYGDSDIYYIIDLFGNEVDSKVYSYSFDDSNSVRQIVIEGD